MQPLNRSKILLALVLVLCIFSFSTTTFIEDSSQLYYESLLDDNGEQDDKEEKIEKTLLAFFQSFLPRSMELTAILPCFVQKLYVLIDKDPHFRPPIFS